MTQPQRVLYLPPGVVPGAPPPQQQMPVSGLPFDRTFFEQVLPQAVQAFCTQLGCTHPVVELLTVDGTTHFVNGIVGVADQWVALQTSQEGHDHVTQVFLPYATVFRVEVHPSPDSERNHLGFVLDSVKRPPQLPAPAEETAVAAAKPVAAASKPAATKPAASAKK